MCRRMRSVNRDLCWLLIRVTGVLESIPVQPPHLGRSPVSLLPQYSTVLFTIHRTACEVRTQTRSGVLFRPVPSRDAAFQTLRPLWKVMMEAASQLRCSSSINQNIFGAAKKGRSVVLNRLHTFGAGGPHSELEFEAFLRRMLLITV